MLRSLRLHAKLFRRFLAAGAVALVLALDVLAACPVLHDWLHGHKAIPGDEDDCAVVLFASGVSLPLGAIAVAPPAVAWRELTRPFAPQIFFASPHYLHPPECGPPLA